MKSAYEILDGVIELDDIIFYKLWSNKASPNVISLAWKLLLNRIQTREYIRKRRVLLTEDPEVVCPFTPLYSLTGEFTFHLFFTCSYPEVICPFSDFWPGGH